MLYNIREQQNTPMPIEIITEEARPGYFVAVIKGTYKTGRGDSEKSAIGELVQTFPEDFNITLEKGSIMEAVGEI
jgi:hypothetical protein